MFNNLETKKRLNKLFYVFFSIILEKNKSPVLNTELRRYALLGEGSNVQRQLYRLRKCICDEDNLQNPR